MVADGFEAAGDIITGAVVGRAFEPGQGEGKPVAGNCQNCATPLIGAHCHACGQKAQVHRTLAAYGHDLLHGVFHFEGKIWRTLPMLAFKPGALTRRYVHGERARFVSPLALFLFSVFLMFAVFETVGGPVRVADGGKNEFRLNTATKEIENKIVTLTRERVQLAAQGKDVTKIDAAIAYEREGRDFFAQINNLISGKPSQLKADLSIDTGSQAMDNGIQQALQNPKLLLYKLQSSAYKFAWALIPLSLPFMWAMFAWRRHYKIYDHAVFVTYSLSFVMLLVIIMAVISAMGVSAAPLIGLVPVHFFLQLKGAYVLTPFSAAWRTITMLFFAATVLTAFGLLLLALGLMG